MVENPWLVIIVFEPDGTNPQDVTMFEVSVLFCLSLSIQYRLIYPHCIMCDETINNEYRK